MSSLKTSSECQCSRWETENNAAHPQHSHVLVVEGKYCGLSVMRAKPSPPFGSQQQVLQIKEHSDGACHSPLQINKSNSLSQIHLTLSFLISLEAPAKRSNFTASGFPHRQAMCSAVSSLSCTTTTTKNDAKDQLFCTSLHADSVQLASTHPLFGGKQRKKKRKRAQRDQHSTASSASSS